MQGHARLGSVVADFLRRCVRDRPRALPLILEIVGGRLDDAELEKASAELDGIADQIRPVLGHVLGEKDVGEVSSATCSTCIRGRLLHRLAYLAADPGAELCAWLWDGAGAGIAVDPVAASSVFPSAAQDIRYCEDAPTEDYTDNQVDQEALAEIERFTAEGWLEKFDKKEDAEKALGGPIVVSPFHVIIKNKNGKVKRRLILDLKRSGISARTRHTHRVVLPRISDAVQDALKLIACAAPEEHTEFFILDFQNAFWNIPLHPLERRFFVGAAAGKLWAYRRAAQGSRNGPLAWAGPVSVLMRLTQGMLGGLSGSTPPRARGQLYVDDPAFALLGTVAARDEMVACIVLFWRLLGFPLSLAKAKRGKMVVWIGCELEVLSDCIFVRISAEKVEELTAMTSEILRGNVVSAKVLQKYAGLANFFASVLYVWRPFLSELWAAIQAVDSSLCGGAPPGCVWTKMISPALLWISAFLRGRAGALEMEYRVTPFLNRGDSLRIVGDASVWGLGAYLMINGVIVEWYADRISEHDRSFLGVDEGDPRSQQVVEALNLLVALRVWFAKWARERVSLEVRADNVAALTMILHLKGSSPALNAVAREVALDLGNASFRPDVVAHTPGVASNIADKLSRLYAPGSAGTAPTAVSGARRVRPEVRAGTWWRAGGLSAAQQAGVLGR